MQPPPPSPPGSPSGDGLGGAQRFFKYGLIGGAVGGVLSSIPFLNLLNCCFCLLNLVGSTLAVALYLKESPNERLSSSDAALCGGIAGAVAGLVAGVLGLILSLAMGTMLASFYASLPPQVASNMTISGLSAIIQIPFYMIGYGGMGALGGFLSMQLLFKDRLAA
jgi:hypothetical protein